jgi:hypothetical protein
VEGYEREAWVVLKAPYTFTLIGRRNRFRQQFRIIEGNDRRGILDQETYNSNRRGYCIKYKNGGMVSSLYQIQASVVVVMAVGDEKSALRIICK